MSFLGMSKDMGIDLGTSNTVIYVKGKGIVLEEPSVIAINRDNGNILAVGKEAKEMIGKTPDNIITIRPMKGGVIADYNATQKMISYFIKKLSLKSVFTSPRIVVCYPSCITEVERNAIENATRNAGARDVFLLEEPRAAAIGADLPIGEPTGCMVVGIGGGTTEIAVLSLGGIVTSQSIRVAGDEFDNSIIVYMRREYNLAIGEKTAEEIKINIGCVRLSEDGELKSMKIKGRDLLTGLPKYIFVTEKDVEQALRESVHVILDAIKYTLEKTPPELSADVMRRGITLTGGGAMLKGLDKIIEESTHVPVHVAEKPLECVALGAGKALQNINIIHKSRK
ncbi:rod shape-determining protein MreB [Hathewaya proteolytica DSM 3090]|uniref:Cell shape-determining protein MreB n=1 Tax=Hathewaya proteolytica DSM 3090 TaxID=1121331 RepID=A0A1M6JKU9_9CLOT|nr:rod shape-determining protein [Hathewaya proteolytica]SHJ47242.1 rod shape-determining protein MreB [Hathewaya proteolytica DSM 3090]